jgi:hypothetical protein
MEQLAVVIIGYLLGMLLFSIIGVALSFSKSTGLLITGITLNALALVMSLLLFMEVRDSGGYVLAAIFMGINALGIWRSVQSVKSRRS